MRDEPRVQYIQHWGSDLSVVNSARCSFGKRVETIEERDKKLINYLADHEHTTPYRHAGATFLITCPIFVARQIHKHQVGVNINEISGRYVEMDPEDYHHPGVWREAAPSVKQGSAPTPADGQADLHEAYARAMRVAYDTYKQLISYGVCREQARMVLPQSMLTQFWMSASLQAWAHFYTLRGDSHAQKEVQTYAVDVDKVMRKHFPHSWEALTKRNSNV